MRDSLRRERRNLILEMRLASLAFPPTHCDWPTIFYDALMAAMMMMAMVTLLKHMDGCRLSALHKLFFSCISRTSLLSRISVFVWKILKCGL